ncbi:hypothetical protein B296_00014456 [Ensete ventricosum]|uniref:Uncharacterized protein n=1 Tax=Ensete ventricosum TaxID=4639 RepID=A0A426X860_ENSVE|nr:hypothetical protein B296_00014456 [Ensete ventricosum]
MVSWVPLSPPRLSFSQKDVITPLAPSTSSSLSLLLLRRRRLPLPTGSHPAKGRPPLRLVSSPLLAVGLAVGGSPLRAPYSRPRLWARCCKWVYPRAVADLTGWPQPVMPTGVAPTWRLAVAGRPSSSLPSL